jgi:uncharacterized protein (DUF3084 family)
VVVSFLRKTELGGGRGVGVAMDRKDYMRRYRDAHRDELQAYRDAHKDERQAYRDAHKDELRDTREAARLLRIKANEPLRLKKEADDELLRHALWDAYIQDKLRTLPPAKVSDARHPDCDLNTAQNSIDATLFS